MLKIRMGIIVNTFRV